ncbi:hypothetical protein D9M71_576010 [compost metagenome]
MATNHQSQCHQGPDDGQARLDPHGFEQGLQLERHAAPMVSRAHHQGREEQEQRNTDDQLLSGGHSSGIAPADRQLRGLAAGPGVDAEQSKQQAQIQRADQRYIGQGLSLAVTDDIGQPEPAQHQQCQRRGGIHTVFAGVGRHRPGPGTRCRHQHQVQARQ